MDLTDYFCLSNHQQKHIKKIQRNIDSPCGICAILCLPVQLNDL